MQDIIQDMRKRCRLAMDGMKSASMRTMGLEYKLNFGLIQNQIRSIAADYEPNEALAEELWKQETRELIILGTLLYPLDKFTAQKAHQWVHEVRNQEVREQVCLNLFQELEFADQLAIEWANDEDPIIRTSGYWLMARLLLTKKYQSVLDSNYFHHLWDDIADEDVFLRNSALLTLKHIGRQSEDEANEILDTIIRYKNHSDPLKQEAYNALAFEFNFIWG